MHETTSLSPVTSSSAEEQPTPSAYLEISVRPIEMTGTIEVAEERPTPSAYLEISVRPIEMTGMIEVVAPTAEAPC